MAPERPVDDLPRDDLAWDDLAWDDLPRDDLAGRHCASERGFTLLEVLVAFVIAALALGVLFQGAIEGLASVHLADRTTEALARARSHLAAVGHGIPLRTQTQQGEDGSGFTWSLAIRPLSSAPLARTGGDGRPSAHETLFEVRVTESWDAPQGTRGTTLVTRRAAITPVAPP